MAIYNVIILIIKSLSMYFAIPRFLKIATTYFLVFVGTCMCVCVYVCVCFCAKFPCRHDQGFVIGSVFQYHYIVMTLNDLFPLNQLIKRPIYRRISMRFCWTIRSIIDWWYVQTWQCISVHIYIHLHVYIFRFSLSLPMLCHHHYWQPITYLSP